MCSIKLTSEDILLKPYLDTVFKAVFTSETEASNMAFCDFLSSAIGKKVVEATILQNEPAVASLQEKQIRYDISCTFNDGETANVEVQVQPVAELPKRLEYYASKFLLSQNIKGCKYKELKKTYQISILVEGKMFCDEYAVHCFEQYDRMHNISLTGNVRIITGELSKLDVSDVQGLSTLERWLTWFKCAGNPQKQAIINELIEKEEGIQMATKVLVKFSTEGATRRKAELEEKILMDYQNDMLTARDEGIEKGKQQRNIEIATNMIKAGIELRVISQATELSAQEIERIAQNKNKNSIKI